MDNYKTKVAAQRKKRYAEDPEYRAKEQARAKERYHRVKQLVGEKTGPKKRPAEERFWENVVKGSEDECWEWKGASRNKTSYGSISVDGKTMPAYRYSWILHNGPLTKDQYVRSGCRNKLCVNPNHLYIDGLEGVRNPKLMSFTDEEAFARRVKATQKAQKHYQANKEVRNRYIQEYQMVRKIKAANYLGGSCQRCGFNHPSALQFHHRDPSLKTLSITTKELGSPKKYPWKVIQQELDKCDLICANCHFLEHAVLTPERVNELREEVENESS